MSLRRVLEDTLQRYQRGVCVSGEEVEYPCIALLDEYNRICKSVITDNGLGTAKGGCWPLLARRPRGGKYPVSGIRPDADHRQKLLVAGDVRSAGQAEFDPAGEVLRIRLRTG